jgi:hypothetical protein
VIGITVVSFTVEAIDRVSAFLNDITAKTIVSRALGQVTRNDVLYVIKRRAREVALLHLLPHFSRHRDYYLSPEWRHPRTRSTNRGVSFAAYD